VADQESAETEGGIMGVFDEIMQELVKWGSIIAIILVFLLFTIIVSKCSG
jgi:hypothetical protein